MFQIFDYIRMGRPYLLRNPALVIQNGLKGGERTLLSSSRVSRGVELGRNGTSLPTQHETGSPEALLDAIGAAVEHFEWPKLGRGKLKLKALRWEDI